MNKDRIRIPIVEKVVLLVVALTNLSQLPFLISTQKTQFFSYSAWLVMFLMCGLCTLIKHNMLLSKPCVVIIALMLSIVTIQAFQTIITQNDYFGSSLFIYLFFSILILLSGNLIANYISDTGINKLLVVFVFSTLIVEMNVYTDFFIGVDAFQQKQYVYSSKNSVSFILITALIICFVIFPKQKRIIKTGLVLFGFVTIFVLFLLKSRASLLGLFLVVLIMLFSKITNPKIRRFFWLIIFSCAIVLYTNDALHDIVINNVLLANNDINNLDSISSGRFSLLERYPQLVDGHVLFGVGSLYYECAPLSAFLQFGIFLGLIYLFLMFFPLVYSFIYRKTNEHYYLLFLIAVAYCSNAFFEGLAPFGPGAKCYLLWFLWGILMKRRDNKVLVKNNEFDQ